jgi:hypothetical protein
MQIRSKMRCLDALRSNKTFNKFLTLLGECQYSSYCLAIITVSELMKQTGADSSGRSSGGLEERRAATSNGRRDERRTHKPKPPIDPMFRMIAGAGTLEGSFHLLRYGNVSGKSGPRQKPIDTLRRRVAYRFLSGERGAPSKAYERRMGEIPFKVSASEPSKG